MAMLPDAIVGAVVGELLRAVLDMKDKAVKFKPTLTRLESTLNSLQALIKEIEELNKKLDRPKDETERLIKQMQSGRDLVLKCSKVQWWECCYKPHYQEELEELDREIRRFFKLDIQAQIARDGKDTLVVVRDIQTEIRRINNTVPRNERIELSGICSPPRPPEFTVGLDVPLMELKLKLLHDGASVLTVTGSGGCGKTTLAKKLCWDDQVRGKFKDNIFFITFAKTPKFNTIVQKLLQHTRYQVPEFQSDEDAANQLEHLLCQIAIRSPILLVLDDVWPGSESLVEKFVFQISDYKILVTSRVAIGRYGTPYVLKRLADADAIKLFQHSASLKQNSSDVPEDVVKEIVKGCSGSPLALRVSGRSLSQQHPVVWNNRAKDLSRGRSILDSNSDLLDCLQKSFDLLDSKTTERFRDLSLFPEDQRISAASLVDMWTELYDDDDASALENIFELVRRNMADIIVTRKVSSDTVDYNYHYVTQHDLLRELAIHQTSHVPEAERNRFIIDMTVDNIPKWWTTDNIEYHIKARVLSICTDEVFTPERCNFQPTEVEVLVLNLRANKFTLPMFVKKMNKLKVLIITNYDYYPAELENFELLDYLSDLKRIRLDKVSIPFLSNTGVQLKNLQKLSFSMCNVNEAFKNCTFQIADILPNLVEMNIDYCNMVELPVGVSNIASLKKLSIRNCHKLCALPEGIGNLVNLESLVLSSCSGLEELPESITRLHKLKLLDISYCVSLSMLPENMGELCDLQKLNVRGCSRLSDLPSSIMDLGSLRYVVCDDEEMYALWETVTTVLKDLRLELVKDDSNLDWLL